MPIVVTPELRVATIGPDRKNWSLVVERELNIVRLITINPDGEPRGFVTVSVNDVGALKAALDKAVPG
jgi:hypothetical protein